MQNSLSLDLSLDQPDNFFTIDNYFPDDVRWKKITVSIDAIELAKYLHPDQKLWVDIETIYVECFLNDLIELLPTLQINEMIEDDELKNLSTQDCVLLLTKLKQENKYYEISDTPVASNLRKCSLESHKDLQDAVNDVKVDIKQLPGELEKKHVSRVVVNFFDPYDNLNDETVKQFLSDLEFYKYDDIKYEYNILKVPNKFLIEKLIYFFPNHIGF